MRLPSPPPPLPHACGVHPSPRFASNLIPPLPPLPLFLDPSGSGTLTGTLELSECIYPQDKRSRSERLFSNGRPDKSADELGSITIRISCGSTQGTVNPGGDQKLCLEAAGTATSIAGAIVSPFRPFGALVGGALSIVRIVCGSSPAVFQPVKDFWEEFQPFKGG